MGSNLDIVNDWVNGNNLRPASIGFVGLDNLKEAREREVGDQWEDADGKIWEKTTYGKKSIPKVLSALAESNPTCSCCEKEIEFQSRYDNTTYRNTKMCFDCTVEEDTQRRIAGTYKDYETRKVMEKQKDWVTDMLAQLKDGLAHLEENTTMEFVNEFGDLDRWGGMDVEKLRGEMEKEIQEGEDALVRIEKTLADLDE